MKVVLVCCHDPEHELSLDYLAAGLERDGLDVGQVSSTSNGSSPQEDDLQGDRLRYDSTAEEFVGRSDDVDVVVTFVGIVDLGRAIPLLRAARRRWSRSALVVVSDVPDLRLLGPDWKHRPTGVRFIAIPALTTAEELSAHVKQAALHPYAEVAPTDLPLPLTDTQVELLDLIAAGFTNAEIAHQRHSTEKAVRNMVGRIARRLGIEEDSATNVRATLVRYRLVDHAGRARSAMTDTGPTGREH